MTQDQITELTVELTVLHFIVHQLMVVHCENEQDPVAFAQGLSTEIEELVAGIPQDEQWQIDMQERMRVFFGQVVSTLKSKTSHHDA